MKVTAAIVKEYFYMIYYGIFFNLVAVSHYLFSTEIKNILKNSFNLENETDQSNVVFDNTSFYSRGLVISGIVWPFLIKKMSLKKALLISTVCQALTFLPMGMVSSHWIIPIMFMVKGATSNIYNVGIAFIYTFCKKDNLKFQFSVIVIFTAIFGKLMGTFGSYLYHITDQSFFKVNVMIASVILAFGFGFMFLYKDVIQEEKQKEAKKVNIFKTLIEKMS